MPKGYCSAFLKSAARFATTYKNLTTLGIKVKVDQKTEQYRVLYHLQILLVVPSNQEKNASYRRLRMRYVSQELNSIRKSLTMIVLYRKVMVRNILIWHFIHSTMQPLYESQNVTQFYYIVADPG